MFARYPDASAYAEADLAELEGYVRNTGFYRQKAKTIRDVCRELLARFGGEVPRTMEEMVTLPGVARKTANVVPGLAEKLPEDWRTVLAEELNKDYCQRLQEFIAAERVAHTVFPAEHDVFNAFKLTPYERVKVLLLGQDPYHDDGQAHGLCFSVRPGVKPPPSLVNIFKELHSDLGCPIPNNGYLTPWAEQGVMLLNAVLTVRAHEPASHAEHGWETFTDAVIAALSARKQPLVFVLWGAYAQKKSKLIDSARHRIVTAAHPSPLSVKKFFGSKPFSQINTALGEFGETPINWQLPDIVEGTTTDKPIRIVAPQAKPAKEKEPEQPAAAASAPPPPTPVPHAHIASLLDTVLNYEFSLRHQTLLPQSWQAALADQFTQPYFQKLEKFVAEQRRMHTVCPAEMDVFHAFRLTPLEQVKVVLLGDEPPAGAEQADGLAFSVRSGAKPTPAAVRMFEALHHDLGCWPPSTGRLAPWARQGVLLLNCVLTVDEGEPGSHERKGWETFTDAVLRCLSAQPRHIVFVLWGEQGRKKERLLDPERHTILTGPHPLERGFSESRPFSAINDSLELHGQSAVWWQLFAG